jgi:hypothetical protein
MSDCKNCGKIGAAFSCGNQCWSVVYCNDECARQDFETHKSICVVITDPKKPYFKTRGLYKNSLQKIEWAYKNDILAWFAVQHYLAYSYINAPLFKVNGDWSKFNNDFNGMNSANPTLPRNKFTIFFYHALQWQRKTNRYIGNYGPIDTEAQLLRAFPKLQRFFQMSNADFMYEFVTRFQNLIQSVPPSRSVTHTFRGYVAINIPNTLSVDISALRIGQEITTWAFMSVALDPMIAARYVRAGCCYLHLTIPPGFRFMQLSGYDKDDNFEDVNLSTMQQTECVLPAGTIVRIDRIYAPSQRYALSFEGKYSTVITKSADVTVIGVAPIKGIKRR